MAPSPILEVFYAHHPIRVLCDSGAELSLIKLSVAVKLGLEIKPTVHSANQADGKSRLTTCGEVHLSFTCGDITLPMEAIVLEELGCDVIGGAPFLEQNQIVLDMPNRDIAIQSKHRFPYAPKSAFKPPLPTRQSASFLLKAPAQQTILPGENIELPTPDGLANNTIVAIEPRMDTGDTSWITPHLTECMAGVLHIPNTTSEPIRISKHQHLAQAYYTLVSSDTLQQCDQTQVAVVCQSKLITNPLHSQPVSLDPDGQLTDSEHRAFAQLHERYDMVFNRKIGKYNDASGRIRASFNMGPVPPPAHKARLPAYSPDKMKLLQHKMDELEEMGVLAKTRISRHHSGVRLSQFSGKETRWRP